MKTNRSSAWFKSWNPSATILYCLLGLTGVAGFAVGTTNNHSPRSAQVEFYGNVVPEPSTWALLLGGAGLLMVLRRRRTGVGSLLLVTLAAFSGSANAQTVGVQFYNSASGTPLASTQTAGVIPQNHFNLVLGGYFGTGSTGTTGILLASDGTDSGIQLTHSSHDGYATMTDSNTPNGSLLHYEDKTGGNVGDLATYTFSNLAAVPYNLIAYIESDQAVNANLTVGALTYYVIDGGGTTTDFVNASNLNPAVRVTGNYVEFYGLIPVNGQITLTNLAVGGLGNTTATINGLQLQAVVPEPSTWALLLGGVGLFIVGQRFRRSRLA